MGLARLRRRLAREVGIALVLALLVMGVLTITTISIALASTSNESSFGRDRQVNRALNIAEAGLNSGIDAVKALPTTATTLSNGSGSIDQGSYTYTATQTQDTTNPNLYYWTITSTGRSPDGKATRIISTKVSETITQSTQTITTPPSPAYNWGLFLGDANSDCTTGGSGNTLGGSSGVTVDVYIKGSLCVSGNSSPFILQPTGTTDTVSVYIGKKFKSKSNASPIGTSSAKLHLATIVGGCIDGNHSNQTVVCSKQGSPLNNTSSPSYGSGVYATSYSSTQNDIPRPTIDPAWYTNAQPGPATGCNNDPTNSANRSSYPSNNQSGTPEWSASTFKSTVLDNDGTRNTSLTTNPIDILQLVNNWNQIMNSFDCRYYAADGTLLGRFAWTYPSGGMSSSNPGTLIVEGTVFMDGNLNFSSSDYAVYQGRGTLYVNGTVTITAGAKICAQPISGNPCSGNFDPDANLLEIVAVNAGNVNPGFSLTGAGIYEGVSFVNGRFNAGNGSSVNGPVIADTGTLSGNAKLRTTVDPPSGAPGASTTTTTTGTPQATWAVVPGSWQQLK